jgi:hypothetical protein
MVISYNGRRFRAADGNADEPTIATYFQDGDLLWGESSGGDVRRGSLTGLCAADGTVDFAYTMVLRDGEVVAGRCFSTPEILDDGRIRLREKWERYGANGASGVSYLEELPGGAS